MKDKIIELREKGLSFRAIQKELGCSKSTVAYHLSEGQKEKSALRTQKRRTATTEGIIGAKLERFISKALKDKHRNFQRREGSHLGKSDIRFTYHDVITKFGPNPVCAYTGEVLDWSQPSTYHFDHIIPSTRGGDNSLDNLAVCSSRANVAKSDMTPDELLEFCKNVVKHMESNP